MHKAETPYACIQRELKEETGLVAQNWKLLQEMHLSNSVSDEISMVYLATDLEQFEAQPEESEKLRWKVACPIE